LRKVFLGIFVLSGLGHGPLAMAQTRPDTKAADIPDTPPQSTARITEDVPDPRIALPANFIRVAPQDSKSGFRVPRYVSLKYGSSNGRTGPSSGHPVAWRYSRKGMPMIVVAETEIWRKVRDVNGDETWMDRRLLDGRRMILARAQFILRDKPRSDSKKTAVIAKGALLRLEGCDDLGWCKLREQDGKISGYALQTLLWGAEPL